MNISKLFAGEYDANLCTKPYQACTPCADRLPSCVGLQNGDHPITFMLWTSTYAKCYRNRTMAIEHCANGYFHPRQRQCLNDVYPGTLKKR